MNINDIYEVDVIDVNNFGVGIAKVNSMVIFINNALVGEKLRVRIIDIKKNFAYGDIIEFISKSLDRIEVKCPYYNECGGCSFLHTNIDNENKIKENYIKRLFSNYKVTNIICNNEYSYRNKVTLHVKNKKLGLYREDSNDLVCINKCLLLDDKINDVIKALNSFSLENINEIIIRKSFYEDCLMIIFDDDISSYEIDLLKKVGVSSLYVKDRLVFGKDYLIEKVGDFYFSIYPYAFFQVNNDMIKKLYDVVKNYAGSGDSLLDLYCGTGTIGIYLSNNFDKVYGVEVNTSAISNANINKKLNKVSNIDFKAGDASCVKNRGFDVVVVDPPRKGLSKDVINNLLFMRPKKIVYVSCNPNTLKRDIQILSDYEVKEITPLNCFCKTSHIECVCLLILKEG